MSFRIDQLAVLNLATVGNSITAGSFVKSGGTSSQFLKADGTVDTNAYITGITSGMVTTALGYTPVPNTRNITINGVTQDLSVDRTWTISAGVSSVSGSGAGISVSPTTGAVVVSNTGVTSNVAGTGISVSGATGAVTITNTGVTSIVAGTAISISGATGAVTINNAGVTSLNGNTGAITGIITTSNYNSYSPTLTGGGASGTWGINISGNADTVDNFHASQSTVANNIVVRDANGYIFGNYINMTDDGNPGGGTSITSFITKQGDNYYRSVSPTNAMVSIRGVASGSWGINITGTAGSETLATVTGRGASTSTAVSFNNSVSVTSASIGMDWWRDAGGTYMEFYGTSTATRKLRLQGHNGSGSYAQLFIDGGNNQVYTTVGGVTNFLVDGSVTYLRHNGSDKFWTGSDGTRNAGWLYMQNGGNGIHYPGYNSHFYMPGGNYWHINPTEGSGYGALILYSHYNGSSGGSANRKGYLYYDSNGFGLLGGGDGDWAINVNTSTSKYVTIGGHQSNNAYNSVTGVRLMFGGGNSDAQGNYYIGTNLNNYGGNYNKLDLAWHTGIRIGAQTGYGGIRMYNDEDFTTLIFSVGEGDSNVRVTNNLFMGGNLVATQSWVSSQGYVTGGPFLPLAGGTMSGDIAFPNDSAVALKNASGTAGFRPDDQWGNIYTWNYSGGYYVDATAYYLRSASATLWMTITGSGTVEAMADMRAPIFYDSQDTTYYADFHSTSQSAIRVRGGALHGPNPTWGKYLLVGGDGRQGYIDNTDVASVSTTNGNLHIDAASGYGTYINWYDGSELYFGRGNSSAASAFVNSSGYWNFGNTNSASYLIHARGDIYADGGWVRVSGTSGLYFESYAGGWHMTDSTYVRSYNGKSVHMNSANIDYVGSIYFNSGPATGYLLGNTGGSYGSLQINGAKNGWYGLNFESGNTLMMNSGESGHHQQGVGWKWRWYNGQLYVSRGSTGGGAEYTVWDSGNAPRAGNSLLMYYQGFTLDANTMDGNSSGFTYSNNAPFTGPVIRISETGYSLWFNAAYAGGGTQLAFRTRNGDSATLNPWRTILHDANYNSYSPTLTGGGASGTWSINITGSAGSVDFNNLTNQTGGTGTYQTSGDFRAPIFYDSANTSYFCDPAGTSNLVAITTGATGVYNTFNSWTNLNGYHGFYSSVHNGAHFYPNDGSYGSWRISGSRNGWGGIEFANGGNGAVTLMNNNDSNTSGFHNNSYGWQIRWYNGTLYIGKNSYGGNEATVLDSSNYTSYAAQVNGNVSNTFNVFQLSYAATNFNPSAGPRTLMNSMSVKMWNNYFNGTGLGSDYGTVMQYYSLSGHVDTQVYFDANGETWYRSAAYAAGWQSWKRYMTDSNSPYAWNMNQYVRTSDAPTFNGVYTNDWFRANGCTGFYFQSYGHGLRAPECEGNTYGNVCTYGGGRNGWAGYGITASFTMMGRSGTDVGLHDNGSSWIFYSPYGTQRLGFGTSTTSASYRIYVSGAIYATGDVVAYSDRRKKTDIVTIDNALEKVTNLRGVFYTKIGEEKKGRKTGVIAQEINEVLPEVVTYASDTDEYGVSYGNIAGVLIEAIKEQNELIKTLKSEIDQLKAKLE